MDLLHHTGQHEGSDALGCPQFFRLTKLGAVGLGNYQGREPWVELHEGDSSLPGSPISWRDIPGGKKAPGQNRSTELDGGQPRSRTEASS